MEVDAVTLVEPFPAVGTELIEGASPDQAEGLVQISQTIRPGRVGSFQETLEQVEVDQKPFDLVDGEPAGPPGRGVARVREVAAGSPSTRSKGFWSTSTCSSVS